MTRTQARDDATRRGLMGVSLALLGTGGDRTRHRTWIALLGCLLAFGGLLIAAPAAPLSAANPLHVMDCGDSGATTLRGRIASATTGDTIVFDLDCTGATAITVSTGTLTLTKNVTIDGTGHTVAVDGNNAARVFTVNSGVTATLNALVIQHGKNNANSGGGILNQGTLTVNASTLAANSAFSGGGIENFFGTVTVTNSTLTGNSASGGGSNGGGIDNDGGIVSVANSTFTGNVGGAIENSGTLTAANSTFTGNVGGIVTNGTVTLTNTVLAANTDPNSGGMNCQNSGTITDGGHNLEFNPTNSCGFSSANHDVFTDPLLASLGTYGGPTQTLALLPGSPAINAGDDAICAATGPGKVNALDQRGIARSQGAHCDIGAFESRGFSMSVTGGGTQSTIVNTAFPTPLQVTVSDTHAEPVSGGVVTFTVTPANGAAATLTAGTATLNGSGVASMTATANGTAGTYSVTASASGATPNRTFTLTNTRMVPIVNNNGDGAANVANCAPGNANTCRLRDAIAAVNGGVATEATITFAANETITLNTGTLTLMLTSAPMTIDGSGHTIIVDGNHADTVFTVNSSVTAALNRLTIQHGSGFTCGPITCGGGIYNSGALSVTNSSLSGNAATNGGGVYNNGGVLTVTNSTLSGNTASGIGAAGGGILNDNGTLIVTSSTLASNTADVNGGGILNDTGTVTVTNSTLSGNTATHGIGGGIANNGTATVTNSTFSGNSAGAGGGIGIFAGTLTVTNTIVAGNGTDSSGPDLYGTIATGGHNLFGDTTGATITLGPGDLVNPNPLLGAFGNYGGPTRTIPLLPGSPAIDAGDDAVCAGAPVGNQDQRGIARPQGAHCDIGAFEYAVINLLPGPKPPGPVSSPPNPLPGARPVGPTGGSAPNPLPVPRP